MITTTITCDRCNEVIVGTPSTLSYEWLFAEQYESGSWQFHFKCFHEVKAAIHSVLAAASKHQIIDTRTLDKAKID